MDLQGLINEVERRSPSANPLNQLAEAAQRHDELADEADQLLDHFIQAAREAGCSWTQIGGVLGVSKQAAQQRHRAGQGVLGWLRKRAGQRGLFTRFTDRARAAAQEAQEAARALDHNYVGTEHILIALLSDPDSLAAKALASWRITREQVVADVENRIGRGGSTPSGHIPFTPRAKEVLELSLREALSLGHNYIGTEHILLGVLGVEDGVAAQILLDRHVTPDKARKTVTDMLAGYQLRRSRGDEGGAE
jgi:hypothetical protein